MFSVGITSLLAASETCRRILKPCHFWPARPARPTTCPKFVRHLIYLCIYLFGSCLLKGQAKRRAPSVGAVAYWNTLNRHCAVHDAKLHLASKTTDLFSAAKQATLEVASDCSTSKIFAYPVHTRQARANGIDRAPTRFAKDASSTRWKQYTC
jgi:hypothetical protein